MLVPDVRLFQASFVSEIVGPESLGDAHDSSPLVSLRPPPQRNRSGRSGDEEVEGQEIGFGAVTLDEVCEDEVLR